MNRIQLADNANDFMQAFAMYEYYMNKKPDRVYTVANLENYRKYARKKIRNILLKLNGEEYSTALELLELQFGDYTQFM